MYSYINVNSIFIGKVILQAAVLNYSKWPTVMYTTMINLTLTVLTVTLHNLALNNLRPLLRIANS